MFCTNCGKENPDHAYYCWSCGCALSDKPEKAQTITIDQQPSQTVSKSGPFVQAKCTNCGSNLEVDAAKDAAVCPYCGSAFIIEKAVNNYNVSNNINANVVNIFGGNSVDFVIRAGVLEKYNGASSIDVLIPNTVKIIGNGAFKGYAELQSVLIPEGVKEIGAEAFFDCTNLQSVQISPGLVTISQQAFYNCQSLKDIHFPDGLQKIDDEAFHGCCSLPSLSFPNSLRYIGCKAFCGCSGVTNITLPENNVVIEKEAFTGCESLTKLIIPDSGVEIGESSFSDCVNLTSVTVPRSIKFFDYISATQPLRTDNPFFIKGSFQKCTKLKEVVGDEETITKYRKAFIRTPWGFKEIPKLDERASRRYHGRCQFCGGKINKQTNKCKDCGKEKDY